jgi:hypothetical protein
MEEDNDFPLHEMVGGPLFCTGMNEVKRFSGCVQAMLYTFTFCFLWLGVIIGSFVFACFVCGGGIVKCCK